MADGNQNMVVRRLQSLVSIVLRSCKSKSSEDIATGAIQNKTREAICAYQTDLTLLHCAICNISLYRRDYFLCNHGHLTCYTCSTSRACTLCIAGYNNRPKECKNKSVTLMHSKKADDETICYCPVCSAAYSSNKLYDHVRGHGLAITPFTYGWALFVPIPIELGPRRMILQEKNEGAIFLLNHRVLQDQTARVFSVNCIGPPTLNKAFVYKLTVNCKEERFSTESIPKVDTIMTNPASNKSFLIIPSSIGQFLVEVCIYKV